MWLNAEIRKYKTLKPTKQSQFENYRICNFISIVTYKKELEISDIK